MNGMIMKLTTKTRYGVRALLELALNHGDLDPISIKEIAERQSLSPKYLERLFSALQNAGLLTAVRGAQGGYLLLRPPEQINLREVYEVLEGAGGFVDCTLSLKTCELFEECAVRQTWAEMYQASMAVLEATTLADLVQRVQERCVSQPMYHI